VKIKINIDIKVGKVVKYFVLFDPMLSKPAKRELLIAEEDTSANLGV
jgi:hypothetical protein